MKKTILFFFLLVVTISGAVANTPQMRMEILLIDSNSGQAAATTVMFSANTSPQYYPSEDVAITLDSASPSPQVYSLSSDNVACSSNSYGPFNATTVIKLGMGTASPGTFVFSAQQFSGFDPASMIFLEDRQEHIFIDLRQWQYSVLISQAGEISDRFYLHVTYPPTLSSNPASCSNTQGVIDVAEDSSIVWRAVKVIDSVGAIVMVDSGVTGNFNFIGLPGGNYTLEFDYSNYSPTQTITVESHQLITGMNVSNDHDRVYQNIQFYTPGSNATQFQWDFGDGSTITGVSNPTYSYLSPGIYTASVNCTNIYGCSGHADTLMYIETATSIDEIDGNTVKIITDKSLVLIEMDNATSAEYTYNVYNVEGQEIKTGSLNQPQVSLNFSNEASGIYIISIRSNTSSLNKKVLITR